MPETNHTIGALNRLLVLHSRSLPMYLKYARPWGSEEGEAAAVLEAIVADQEEYVSRIGSLILERGGAVRHGEFPIQFTGMHELSWSYLLRQMIERQQRDIVEIHNCVTALAGDPFAHALAEEALGAAQAHLDTLREADSSGRGLRIAETS